MLSAIVDRLKRGIESSNAGEETAAGRTDAPDLYECEGCGEVFISEPGRCSNCDGNEFSNVGTFE